MLTAKIMMIATVWIFFAHYTHLNLRCCDWKKPVSQLYYGGFFACASVGCVFITIYINRG